MQHAKLVNMQSKYLSLVILFVCTLVSFTNSYAQEFKRTTMQVGNLTCPSCLILIESRLKRVPGMTGMTADIRKGLLWADHTASLSADKIAGFITSLGYPAQVVNKQTIPESEILIFGRKAISRCGVGGCNSGGCNATVDAWRKLMQRVVNSVSKTE